MFEHTEYVGDTIAIPNMYSLSKFIIENSYNLKSKILLSKFGLAAKWKK